MRKTIKVLALVLVLAFALSLVPPALAEVNVQQLDYAYLDSTAAYLTVGEAVTMSVHVPDKTGLSFEYTLYYTADREQSNTFEGIDQQKASDADTYTFTPQNPGQYFVEVVIADADYRSQKLQSEPFYCYDIAAREDVNQLPGKVIAIGQEAKAQNLPTQFDTALWLNDWLTTNADYDEPMTIHTPEGVLLQGTGVCESYALAYQMLLHEVGIDSLYVTGYSRGQSHAWNLVNLDGEWTYVDTTWNDPIGGEESHDYFGMNDELLARDHDWSYSNYIPPKAQTLDHNALLKKGAAPFTNLEEMGAMLSAALAAKQPEINYTYTGTDKYFDVSYEIQRWMRTNERRYFTNGYQFGGSNYSGTLNVEYLDMSGYGYFKDDVGFLAIMQTAAQAKQEVVKVAYTGEDDDFMMGSFLSRWLDENGKDLGVTSYQYTYYPFTAEITLGY